MTPTRVLPAAHLLHHVEGAGVVERFHQAAAFLATVHVPDRRRDVLHIQVDGKAEDDGLDGGNREDELRGRISPKLEYLLVDDGE